MTETDEFDPTALDRGTVVWCLDPFKFDSEESGERDNADEESLPGRPVVIANTPDHPFAGEQYIGLSLTTRTWYADQLVEVTEEAWLDGGTTHRSYLIPWSILSPQPDDIEFWIGQLDGDVLTAALGELLPYLHPVPEQLVE
ncbi:hypothetical protein [Halorientalis salina]|uniref:hypothetical protein n=1 Tax=Halorientalis salina TaxID=2932266 RepID=UPI0010AC07DE|nr:hypothetical protein [Halorientalis salina]